VSSAHLELIAEAPERDDFHIRFRTLQPFTYAVDMRIQSEFRLLQRFSPYLIDQIPSADVMAASLQQKRQDLEFAHRPDKTLLADCQFPGIRVEPDIAKGMLGLYRLPVAPQDGVDTE